jgi:hypothetical protein
MSTKPKSPLPVEVDHLKQKVQEWRQTRKGSESTPDAIWDAAVPLAMEFGVCRIGRAVGLDYSWLRNKVARARRNGGAAAPAFLELPSGLMLPESMPKAVASRAHVPAWPPAVGPVIEVSAPTGAQMRICLEAGQGVDAAGIVAAFLGRGH